MNLHGHWTALSGLPTPELTLAVRDMQAALVGHKLAAIEAECTKAEAA